MNSRNETYDMLAARFYSALFGGSDNPPSDSIGCAVSILLAFAVWGGGR